jgi:hypothetical protein
MDAPYFRSRPARDQAGITDWSSAREMWTDPGALEQPLPTGSRKLTATAVGNGAPGRSQDLKVLGR